MKKVIKYIVVALIAVAFIGTFVFLYKKSQPEEIRYQELPAIKQDVARSTVLTGKIVPRKHELPLRCTEPRALIGNKPQTGTDQL